MNGYYIFLPSKYIERLQKDRKRAKSRAFMEYYFDFHNKATNSLTFYAKSWSVALGTVHNWVKEFAYEIEKYHTYWILENEKESTSILKQNENKMKIKKVKNENENTIQHTNKSIIIESELKDKKFQNENKMKEDSNSNNINNINADSNESADQNPSSKKNSYSANFEILWNRYDKKTSNKNRSQSIYLKRWKNTDIKIIIEAIDKYKAAIDLTYQKDFDGFLNGVIDSYVPKRAWVIDSKQNKHLGWFYDNENKFISDSLVPLKLESSYIAEYIETKRFGYVV